VSIALEEIAQFIGTFTQALAHDGDHLPLPLPRSLPLLQEFSDEAMELFKMPRALGQFEDKDVTVSIGRFGPYIAHDGKFYSLGKEFDPYTIGLEEAAPIIVEKRAAKEQRTIKVFEKEKIQLLRGPYGPYIKQGLRNYKLSKEQQERVADLTIEEVKAIIEELKANPPKKVPHKKKSS